jgi:hypothetical protein
MVKMIQNCSYFQHWQETRCLNLIEGLKEMTADTHTTGIVIDEDIAEKFPDIQTPISNMASRCINQQRALWLNKEGPIAIRQAAIAAKAAVATRAALAAANKVAATQAQDVMAVATAAAVAEGDTRLAGPPPHDLMPDCSNCACPNTVSSVRPTDLPNWKGCSSCPRWFCHLVKCSRTMLLAHLPICKARAIVRESASDDAAASSTATGAEVVTAGDAMSL